MELDEVLVVLHRRSRLGTRTLRTLRTEIGFHVSPHSKSFYGHPLFTPKPIICQAQGLRMRTPVSSTGACAHALLFVL